MAGRSGVEIHRNLEARQVFPRLLARLFALV